MDTHPKRLGGRYHRLLGKRQRRPLRGGFLWKHVLCQGCANLPCNLPDTCSALSRTGCGPCFRDCADTRVSETGGPNWKCQR